MGDRDRLKALADGVHAWLAEHPISTQESIEDGARRAVTAWLDANREALVEAIARKVAEGRIGPGGAGGTPAGPAGA